MANTDNPSGFTASRHLTGGTVRMGEYPIQSGDSGDTTGTFSGDVMTQDTDGYADLAAVGDKVLGIFAGCSYTATDGSIVYAKNLPADTATQGAGSITAYIYDDPMTIFKAQHDGTGAFADNGGCFDVIVGTGSTNNGRSRSELDTSTLAVTGQFKQLGLVPTEGNAWGSNAEVEVMVFEHVYGPAAGAGLA